MPPSTTSTWPVMYDGVLGGQERDGAATSLRRAEPLERDLPDQRGARFGRHRRGHVGLDEARARRR